MSAPLSPGLARVAVRELDWIWHDRVALALVLGVPLLAIAVLSLTFSNAVIRDLRVDVVDQDQTQTSMTYVQAVNAAPGVSVDAAIDRPQRRHARRPVRRGDRARSIMPRDLERDIAAGKRPQIVIFYNKQYFTPGNIASSALASAVSAATADLPPFARRVAAIAPGPLVVEQYVLTNPGAELRPVPAARDPADGAARRDRHCRRATPSARNSARATLRDWMAAAGGDPLTALVGKLAPYFGIFVLLHGRGRGRHHPWRLSRCRSAASAVLTGRRRHAC